MSKVTEITTQEAWDQHLASVPASSLLVISFHAPWAAPCKQMAIVIETLASEYAPETSSWVSINAEELSDISEQFDVTAVPFIVLMRNGTVLESVSGSSATRVRAAVEKHSATESSGSATTTAATGAAQSSATPTANGAAAQDTQDPEPPVDPAKAKEELFARLKDLVKAAPVMLFMKGTPSSPQCGFSRQLVALLREKSVKYGFFNILADDEVRQGLKEYADWPTYPQLWIDGELVGGLDIIKEEIENDPEFLKAYSVKQSEEATA
ncbi:Monothiol glutaredoxin-3 [Ceratocystis fimbriata CBS 114723]|uniref:Monothiol glutaredoxin-3 n=1 Tax=Ceratocystis fimbriata CBS 114723 TaxID=1035309 RepID=A0A2C5X3N6_9PEZI|nr:Monothiol glutaredoxin-3 [Ceratocystis fimbriata CBS 114723]